jgi:regulator of sigma D
MKNFKRLMLAILLGTTITGSVMIYQEVFSKYNFEKEYYNEWGLADKSSTLSAKRQHIDNFIQSLEYGNSKGQFAEYDALFLKTPSNNFRTNITALKTLQERLIAVERMDPESFQYNTAIQQITQQEQGEAHEMIGVIKGCYYLSNYPLVWGWIGTTLFMVVSFGWLGSLIFSIVFWNE